MNKLNVFCLPFAGGSKYSYRGFVKQASPHLNFIPIELPGRGTRFKEELLKSADDMASYVVGEMEPLMKEPYAIYGHSMGTLIGYLATHKILERGLTPPRFLVFTGRGGPSVKYDEPVRYLLPRDEFLKKIAELGGCPDEILRDDGMMLFFEPILRADFQVVETFEYAGRPRLDIPITVAIGLSEKVSYNDALAWKQETSAPVEIRQFPGKHFFIFDYERELVEIINTLKIKHCNNEQPTRLSEA